MHKILIKERTIIGALFLLYMCGLSGHKLGTGFDAFFCRITFILLLGAMLLFILLGQPRKKIRIWGPTINRVLFFSFYLISVLWAINKNHVYDASVVNRLIQCVAMTFFAEVYLVSSEDCRRFLKIILWSIVYMSILLIIKTPFSEWGSERVGGALGLHPNDIGIRCACALVISLYFFHQEKQYIYIIIAVLCGVVALFSGSRKAIVIVLLGFSIYWCGREKGWRIILSVLASCLAVVLLLYLVMTNDLLYNVLGKRLERFFLYAEGQAQDTSAIERAFYRNYAMNMFFRRPILGYGGNEFVAEMERIGYSHVAYSHCNYTEIAATLGIIGCILYYSIQFFPLLESICCSVLHHDQTMSIVAAIMIPLLLADYYCVSYYDPFTQILVVVIILLERKHKVEKLETQRMKSYAKKNYTVL